MAPFSVFVDPKQLGRASIDVMSCPSLLAVQQVTNAPSLFAVQRFSKVDFRASRSFPVAQARIAARNRKEEKEREAFISWLGRGKR